MIRLIFRRLLTITPLLLLVSFVIFGLVLLIPGDPVRTILGEDATAESVERLREDMGLDDSIPVQYVRWVGDVLQGDLGTSLYSNQAVVSALGDRFPVTLSLAVGAILVALLVGIPAGVVAGTRRGSLIDRFVTLGVSLGVAIPSFWLGMMLLVVFAIHFGLFPATGYTEFAENPAEWARHLVLPAIALGASAAAEVARQLRGTVVDILHADFVRTARAKGLRGRKVLGKHVLKNATVPVVTVLGIQLTRILGATVIVEQVFAMPGLGQLAIDSVSRRDLPMIQGVVLVTVVAAVLTNLAVDMSYLYFNPRSRDR